MRGNQSRMIDYGSPVNRMWGGNVGCVAWYLALPGFMGGAKWRDLMSQPDLAIGNHGTLTGIVQGPASGWTGTNRQGGYGALRLDGANDLIDMGDPSTLAVGAGNFTLAMWGNFSALPSSGRQGFGRDNAATARILNLELRSGQIQFELWNGTSNPYVNYTVSIVGTGWRHFVGTRTTSSLYLYLDGVRVASGTGGGNLALDYSGGAACTWHIGKSNTGAGELTGSVDDARIYNRALGDAEVRALYLESSQGYPNGLRRTRPWYLANQSATGGGGIFKSGILTSRTIGAVA